VRNRTKRTVAGAATAAAIAAGGAVAADRAHSSASHAAGKDAATDADTDPRPSAAADPATSAPDPPSRIGKGTVQVVSLPSPDAPGGRRKVWIYRPGVPDSASIPVLYFLHGLPADYQAIAAIHGRAMFDRLIRSGAVPPFVFVVPDGNSTRASDPEWANSPAGTRMESFVTGTLRRAVEGSRPRDAAHRAILGFSMGGYGAMNIALLHPSLYGSVAAIAGYFTTDDESDIFRHNPRLLARNTPDNHIAAAAGMRVMLADGTGDREPVTRGETQRFAALLRTHGMHPYLDIRPGTHSSAYLRTELPRVLEYLLTGRVPAG